MPGTYYDTTVEEYLHWPKANYIDPVERTWLAPYAIVMQIIATICVFGRIFLRTRGRAMPSGWDDYFILAAWIFSVAFTVSACVAVWDLQIGRHVWDMELTNWVPALRNGWLAQVFFTHAACATKASILGFYLRLFSNDTRTTALWRWVVWALMALTVGTWIGIFATYCAMCRPLSDYWNWPFLQLTGQTEFHCVDGTAVILAVGALTVASDFWCAALPCLYFQYHDLGLSRRQRVAMNIIFCGGFSVTAVGAVRTYYLWLLAHAPDTSWLGYNLYAVCVAECQLGLICCCAPFLRAFVRKFFPNSSSYLGSRRRRSLYQNRDTKISAGGPSSRRSTWQQQRHHHQKNSVGSVEERTESQRGLVEVGAAAVPLKRYPVQQVQVLGKGREEAGEQC